MQYPYVIHKTGNEINKKFQVEVEERINNQILGVEMLTTMI